MEQEKCLASQRRKIFQQLHLLPAARGQRGPVVKKEGDLRPQRGGQRM